MNSSEVAGEGGEPVLLDPRLVREAGVGEKLARENGRSRGRNEPDLEGTERNAAPRAVEPFGEPRARRELQTGAVVAFASRADEPSRERSIEVALRAARDLTEDVVQRSSVLAIRKLTRPVSRSGLPRRFMAGFMTAFYSATPLRR